MEAIDGECGKQVVEEEDSVGGRRFVCDQYGAAVPGDQRRYRQRDLDQTKSDWHSDGDDRRHRIGAQGRIQLDHFAPFGRDGGYVYRGLGGGDIGGGDQKWVVFAQTTEGVHKTTVVRPRGWSAARQNATSQ